jgi:dihydrofolate reductase
MTRREGYEAPGCEVVGGAREALELLEGEEEVVIGGGAQIYELFADRLDVVHLTVALGRWEGDTRLTPLAPEGWRVSHAEVCARGPRDDAEHAYVVLERVEGARALAPEFAGEVPSGWWSGARE